MQETSLDELVERGRALTGKAACDLISEATSAPGVLVFGELLELDGVKGLANDPSLSGHLTLLQIFAYGTLPEYRSVSSGGRIHPLTQAQELKLKLLTVASLAENVSVLSYADLKSSLEIKTTRELEDLLINECVSTGIVKGKLDQKRETFQVHFAMARDLRPGQVDELIQELTKWREDIKVTLGNVHESVTFANDTAENEKQKMKSNEKKIEATSLKVKAKAKKTTDRGLLATEIRGALGVTQGDPTEEESEEGFDTMDAYELRSGIGWKRRR